VGQVFQKCKGEVLFQGNLCYYYSGHKIVLIIRTEVTEDALPGLSAWEPLNGLSNITATKGFGFKNKNFGGIFPGPRGPKNQFLTVVSKVAA